MSNDPRICKARPESIWGPHDNSHYWQMRYFQDESPRDMCAYCNVDRGDVEHDAEIYDRLQKAGVKGCPFCNTKREAHLMSDGWKCANCRQNFSICKHCGCMIAWLETLCGECACERETP